MRSSSVVQKHTESRWKNNIKSTCSADTLPPRQPAGKAGKLFFGAKRPPSAKKHIYKLNMSFNTGYRLCLNWAVAGPFVIWTDSRNLDTHLQSGTTCSQSALMRSHPWPIHSQWIPIHVHSEAVYKLNSLRGVPPLCQHATAMSPFVSDFGVMGT